MVALHHSFNINGYRVGAFLGLPPPICLPQHARSLKRAQDLAVDYLNPEEKAQIKMLDIFCDAQIHLDSIQEINAQYSLLNTYTSRFESVKVSVQETWSWNLEVCYQSLKLYTLGIGLLPDISDENHQALVYRQLIMQQCLDAASSYISTLSYMSYQPASGSRYPSGILTFYPKHYFTALMASASYIFRFMISSRDLNQAQQSLCMTRLTEAHKIYQSFPDHRDAVRGCINIEMFVHSLRASPATRLPPDLLVKHRLGASVLVDASFRAAQQRNVDVVDGTTPPVLNWSSMNDDNIHRLPLAPEQRFTSPKQPQQPTWQENDIALGIWDAYANDFGVLSEPWVGTDAEFASIMAMTGPTTDMTSEGTFSTSTNN